MTRKLNYFVFKNGCTTVVIKTKAKTYMKQLWTRKQLS